LDSSDELTGVAHPSRESAAGFARNPTIPVNGKTGNVKHVCERLPHAMVLQKSGQFLGRKSRSESVPLGFGLREMMSAEVIPR